MRASKANPIKKISGIAYAPVQCSLSKGEATTKATKVRAKGHSVRVIKKKDGSYCVYTPETSFVNGTKAKSVKGTKPKAVKGPGQRVGAKAKSVKGTKPKAVKGVAKKK